MALPFHPEDASFNRTNALYLAHASALAYNRSPRVAVNETLGLQTLEFRNKLNRTRGFLGVCDTHAVLAFRGTNPATLPNWATDAVVKLVAHSDYEGRVHHGFSTALRKTWGVMEPILAEVEGKPLFITGHSMGGALAVLAACRLAKASRPPVATYTFGAPRVGDANFCAGYSLPTYRVVNRLDLVPELPMASATRMLPETLKFPNEKIVAKLRSVAARVPCYEHINTFVYIDRDGEITTDPDVEPWHAHAVARAIATRGSSFLEGLTDHMMSSYIRGLEGHACRKQTGVRRRPRG